MKNGENQAYPMIGSSKNEIIEQGLTKREAIASSIYANLLSNLPKTSDQLEACASISIRAADELLRQLKEEEL